MLHDYLSVGSRACLPSKTSPWKIHFYLSFSLVIARFCSNFYIYNCVNIPKAMLHETETAASGNRDKRRRRRKWQQNFNQPPWCENFGEYSRILHSTKCWRSEKVTKRCKVLNNDRVIKLQFILLERGSTAKRVMTTSKMRRWSRSASVKTVSMVSLNAALFNKHKLYVKTNNFKPTIDKLYLSTLELRNVFPM